MIFQNLRKNNHVRFACLLGLLLFLILIRYAFQVNIPKALLLIVVALIALLGDKDEIIAACISFIPMHESIDFYYALVICLSVYIFRYFRELRIDYSILLVFLVCIWEVLHCFRSSFSIVDYLAYIIPFVILTILMLSASESFDYSFIVRALAWSTLGIISILIVRVFYFADFEVATALLSLERLGVDDQSGIQNVIVSGGAINPNSLGIIAVLSSAGLMQLRQLKINKISDLVVMCLMILLASLSASRTYLVCLALMFILFIFSEKGGTAKKIKLISFILLGIIVLVIALMIFFPNTLSYFVNRFFEDDLTTGRSDLVVDYHKFIISDAKNLLFGIGLQDYDNRLTLIYRVADNTPHNSLQEIIVAWGLPGLLIFGLLFFNIFIASSRSGRKQRLINWIPLIIILVKSVAGQLLTSSYTMLALSFAYLSLCQDFSGKKEIEIENRDFEST